MRSRADLCSTMRAEAGRGLAKRLITLRTPHRPPPGLVLSIPRGQGNTADGHSEGLGASIHPSGSSWFNAGPCHGVTAAALCPGRRRRRFVSSRLAPMHQRALSLSCGRRQEVRPARCAAGRISHASSITHGSRRPTPTRFAHSPPSDAKRHRVRPHGARLSIPAATAEPARTPAGTDGPGRHGLDALKSAGDGHGAGHGLKDGAVALGQRQDAL